MDSQGGPSRGGPEDRPSRPSGAPRASPRVYRRRRLVVLILALIVIGGLVWAGIVIAGLITSGQDNADGGPAPSGSAQPAPSPADTRAAAGQSDAPTEAAEPIDAPSPSDPACDPGQVEVSASTDAADYAPEQNPVLTLTVTNTGDVACPVNVGTSQMEFLVTSGEDRIFSSVDCQEGAEDLTREIQPGESEEANFTWERNRSAPGCVAVEANPTPGSYAVRVSLGERTSEETSFELQ
ncbi:DUF4232 domain-containing protein [Arthrobacter sp. CAN_A1]|uniref:DUF4232 domain-containing protein n=1 Tax=Arthrobacter sp. CAN_A1 TaxID=2787717 RepID=UPI0018CB6A77